MRRRRLRRTPAGSFNILPCALQGRAFCSCSSRDGCTCLNLAVHHNARWGELLMSQPCFSDACAAAFPCLFGILPAAATDAPHALCVAQFAGQLCCVRLLRRRTVGQLPGRVVCVTPSDRKRSREQVLPLRDLLRPTARRAAVRRADRRRRRLVARSTARRAWRRAGGPRGRAAAACVRRWRGARPQTRRRVICLSAHASYVCRLYFIHTYVYVDCSVCPARLRRSDGSTCCVGRTTTAPRFCFRLLWEF